MKEQVFKKEYFKKITFLMSIRLFFKPLLSYTEGKTTIKYKLLGDKVIILKEYYGAKQGANQ